jgi:uncharacterized membrane protein
MHDAAIVSWPEGKKHPTTKQIVDLVGIGAMSGMFWGMLFGFIFAAPLFGMAIGAALGALGGAFKDYGINDDFIARIRSQVTEGTSALFLGSSVFRCKPLRKRGETDRPGCAGFRSSGPRFLRPSPGPGIAGSTACPVI